jgi:dihydroneopterin triphosphate diphosphatase
MKPKFIAVYLVYSSEKDNPLYLLIRRCKTTSFPKIWQIVTGKVELEENVKNAAFREVKEETGISDVELYNVDVTMFYEQSKDSIAFSSNFCGYVNSSNPVNISEHEHDDFKWCYFEEAYKLLAFPSQKETLSFIHTHFVIQKPDCVSKVEK